MNYNNKMLSKTSAGTKPPDLVDYAKRQHYNMPRSMFNHSHSVKFTFDASKIIPFLVVDLVPGCTINCETTHFIRFNSLSRPVLDNVYVETAFWAVKKVNIFSKWRNIWGHQEFRTQSPTDYVIPFIRAVDPSNFSEPGRIWDYMGIPLSFNGDGTSIDVPLGVPLFSALPFRAYNNIWNWRYRDENLQDPVFDPYQYGENDLDGVDLYSNYSLLTRGKRKDRFTSALASPQKFGSISFNLFGFSPVVSSGDGAPTFIRDNGFSDAPLYVDENNNPSPVAGSQVGFQDGSSYSIESLHWSDTKLQADLTGVSLFSINDFRTAAVAQQILEILNIDGSRYDEVNASLYGVFNDEDDLRIPKFLGGGRSVIDICPVAQTSETTAESEQGRLRAYGVSSGGLDDKHNFIYSSDDHCIVLGLIYIRTDITYQQGLDPLWSRRVATDHLIPIASNLGFETIYGRELYYEFSDITDDTKLDNQAFGYAPRFSAYRSTSSRICGLFRSLAPNNVDEYHYSELFLDRPVLSSQFIEDKSSVVIDRASSVPNESQCSADIYNKCYIASPLPIDAKPGLTVI